MYILSPNFMAADQRQKRTQPWVLPLFGAMASNLHQHFLTEEKAALVQNKYLHILKRKIQRVLPTIFWVLFQTSHIVKSYMQWPLLMKTRELQPMILTKCYLYMIVHDTFNTHFNTLQGMTLMTCIKIAI